MKQREDQEAMKIGWLCSYTPVEIPLAAGLIPVRLDAGDMLLQKPNPFIYQMLCPYVRAVFDRALQGGFGKPGGVIFTKCCDGMFRLHDLWKAHLPDQKVYILPLPKIQSKEAVHYFAQALRRFSESLGSHMGIRITEDDLREAIANVNRLRSAVSRLYHQRLEKPRVMPYSKLHSLIRECLSIPPEQALSRVEKVLEDFQNRPTDPSVTEDGVLVSSSTLDQLSIIELIEKSGLTVLADDHCIGLRHFDGQVSEEGDPYLSLAERYLKRRPCSRMQADPSHLHRLVQEVDETGVKGLILVSLKYCDQAGFDVPKLRAMLKDRRIPMLTIENDYTAGGLGQLKVRIEAFAEMLKEEF
ncbi:MAG: 2-hydroxyacyl-CoA dehydratase family protein [Pseudomonadota bacterium]